MRSLATGCLPASHMLVASGRGRPLHIEHHSTYASSAATFTKVYKIRRNFPEFSGLIFLHTPENNRVSKEKR